MSASLAKAGASVGAIKDTKMPMPFVPRARTVSLAAVSAALLLGPAWPVASAQERDLPPPPDSVDVQAFFDGAQLDQELANHQSPLLQQQPSEASPAAAREDTARDASDPAADDPPSFDSSFQAADDPTGRVGVEPERSWVPENPYVLVVGGFAVLVLAALVLSLARRELRREAALRKVTFRRRRRHRQVEPVPAGGDDRARSVPTPP